MTAASMTVSNGTLRLAGEWTATALETVDARTVRTPVRHIDATAIERLDTAGGLALARLADHFGVARSDILIADSRAQILDLVLARSADIAPLDVGTRGENPLARFGRLVVGHAAEFQAFLSFLGETFVAFVRSLIRPSRIRWNSIIANMETAGVNALPIVGLLSFLLGVVVAYQGGVQLKLYGANIFIVELVSLTLLRELAPLITAIIVAGRTGASYTAQIGTMQVTEEVDALRTIGIDPLDLLVLPKLFALLLALPLVVMFADVMGILGGMVTATLLLDVSFRDFIDRMPQVVSLTSFLIGVGKAPLFAAVVALVGCFQGFRVRGGADSVGRQTTVSVVQAIFLVIVVDAALVVVLGTRGL